VNDQSAVTTFLFTDIERSSRLWEEHPEQMQRALQSHDRILRDAVLRHHGVVVKSTGDGIHAAFQDPLDALAATVEFQIALESPDASDGLKLRVRCGIHAGVIERRDGDYFGSAVNRAARIMNAAHGGQVLTSQAVAELVQGRLPDGVSLRDLGALRLRDLAGAEHVFQVQHVGLRPAFPPLRSLEAVPNNLPQQVTTFIGREREQEQVKAALKKARLLTLTGIGGMGKTRLSLQVAADIVNEYSDGVWFVELAPINDGSLVPQAVATALSVKEESGRPLTEALVAHARERQMLLVLDNCEHLVSACAELARQLLQAGPRIRILASSREPLNITGETIYTVPPLSVPGLDASSATDSIMQFEAVRLFVERAKAMQASFRHSDQDMPAIVEICRRLDGIPLALELAAARVRALSVEQIAARVNDRFRLLTTGDRTAQPRQQTLRAMIDWSYDLLTEKERTLLRRLAVFAGGWTLEAAERVGSGEGVEESEVLDLLTDLVDKSLVMVDADGDRYRLLETVRQYAHELLVLSGEGEDARARHLQFFLGLAENAWSGLVGPQQGDWLARLDLERENLLAAHSWCMQSNGGGESGLKLANSIKQYWASRGQLGLRYRLVVEALAHEGAQSRNLARCHGLFNAGQVCYFMGNYGLSIDYLQEGLAIARELQEHPRIEACLQLLGLSSLGLGDTNAARGYLEEAVARAREQGNLREIAAAVNGLAQFHRVVGELDAAEPLYEDVLALARKIGDRELVAVAELNRAMVVISRGVGDLARPMLLGAIAIAREMGSRPTGQSAIEVTAGLAASQRSWESAARLFGAAESQVAETGLHRDAADESFLAPLMARTRDAMGTDAFLSAVSAGNAHSYTVALEKAAEFLECEDRKALAPVPSTSESPSDHC
jgi:predicted ATPase/class 3 adenylate cyclase